MKVLVGMSGGVDSSVAAYILKKKGYEVIGLYFEFIKKLNKDNIKENSLYEIDDDFIKKLSEEVNTASNYENIANNIYSKNDVDSLIGIYNIAKKLEIPIYYENCATEFENKVIKYFVEEYKVGRTPNPCTYCNGNMKFEKLYEAKNKLNADFIATGHYAKVENTECDEKRFYIKKSNNVKKDQSYMLYTLSQKQLSSVIFPIGDMDKEDVRDVARDLGLDVAEKKDSQDVCFINNKLNDYKEFIKKYDFGNDYREKIARGELSEKIVLSKSYLKKGEFVNKNNDVLGYHTGIINYTIGQRKGLNIAFGERKFVLDIDAEKNRVVLGDNEELFSSVFKIKNIVFQKLNIRDNIKDIIKLQKIVKVRYRHDGTSSEVEFLNDGTAECLLKEPVRAITRGQAAVFYDSEDCILFGGVIV